MDGFHAQRLGRFALGVGKPAAPGPDGSAVSYRNRATNQRKPDVKPPRRSSGRAAAAPALPRYTVDTINERAGNSDLIASTFQRRGHRLWLTPVCVLLMHTGSMCSSSDFRQIPASSSCDVRVFFVLVVGAPLCGASLFGDCLLGSLVSVFGSSPAGFHRPGDPRYRPGSGADTCDTYATFTMLPAVPAEQNRSVGLSSLTKIKELDWW